MKDFEEIYQKTCEAAEKKKNDSSLLADRDPSKKSNPLTIFLALAIIFIVITALMIATTRRYR